MDQIVHYTNKSISDYYPKEEQLILRNPDGTKRIVPESNITYLTGNSPGYVDMLVTLQNANRGLGVEEGKYKFLRLIKPPGAKIYTEVWKDGDKYFYLDPKDTPENGRLPRNWIDKEDMNLELIVFYYEEIKFELYSTLPQFVENRSENEFLITSEVDSLKKQLAKYQKKVNHLETQVNQTKTILNNLFPPYNLGKKRDVSSVLRVESGSSVQQEERLISVQDKRKPPVLNYQARWSKQGRLLVPPYNYKEQYSDNQDLIGSVVLEGEDGEGEDGSVVLEGEDGEEGHDEDGAFSSITLENGEQQQQQEDKDGVTPSEQGSRSNSVNALPDLNLQTLNEEYEEQQQQKGNVQPRSYSISSNDSSDSEENLNNANSVNQRREREEPSRSLERLASELAIRSRYKSSEQALK